jgi:hypothetical protein
MEERKNSGEDRFKKAGRIENFPHSESWYETRRTHASLIGNNGWFFPGTIATARSCYVCVGVPAWCGMESSILRVDVFFSRACMLNKYGVLYSRWSSTGLRPWVLVRMGELCFLSRTPQRSGPRASRGRKQDRVAPRPERDPLPPQRLDHQLVTFEVN